jgi:hypothetical protein
MEPSNISSTLTPTPLQVPLTSGDAAKQLNKSRTTIKTIALEVNAPIIKTPGGQWLFPSDAVQKIADEILRREREGRR